jgi:hypothetical protein
MIASQITAYTKPIIAFLNSSGFHCALTSLNQRYIKTATAIRARSENIIVFTSVKTGNKEFVPLHFISAEFPIIVFVFGNISF